MSKIKITTKLQGKDETHEITTTGIKKNETISYFENNVKVTIILSKNMITLLRKCDAYTIELLFIQKEKTKGRQKIEELRQEIPIVIHTHQMKRKKNKLEINYDLTVGGIDRGMFLFQIEYEVIG